MGGTETKKTILVLDIMHHAVNFKAYSGKAVGQSGKASDHFDLASPLKLLI